MNAFPGVRSIVAVAALFVCVESIAFSQNNTVGRGGGSYSNQQPSLSISSNVSNANIYVDGRFRAQTPATINLSAGTYTILVRANGYQDYTTTVTVNGPTSINAYLQSNGYSLSISSNVNGAAVYIDGNQVGQTPTTIQIQPGNHQVRVSANGYGDYTTNVTINQSSSINANLQHSAYTMSFGQNVAGATIYVDGRAVGRAPLNIQVQPGNHQVRLSLNGYQDWQNNVNVNGDYQFNDRMQASMATLVVTIPDRFLAPGDRNSANNAVIMYVDGRQVGQNNLQIPAGQHSIRFTSGGLSVEQTFNFNAGQTYTLQPALQINVN